MECSNYPRNWTPRRFHFNIYETNTKRRGFSHTRDVCRAKRLRPCTTARVEHPLITDGRNVAVGTGKAHKSQSSLLCLWAVGKRSYCVHEYVEAFAKRGMLWDDCRSFLGYSTLHVRGSGGKECVHRLFVIRCITRYVFVCENENN